MMCKRRCCIAYIYSLYSNSGLHTPIRYNILVLRRVIEDRAAILALTTRVAENEAELMKAKTRQLRITKILDRQDNDIARLSTKAKRELKDYNEQSKQYIRSFMIAFEHGDMDKLPRHPFAPSLSELEQAVDKRKATLIEKVCIILAHLALYDLQ